MNYIIEGGIDFYNEINNITSNTIDNNTLNNCLITHEPLTINYIELSCGHKFNYFPLYKEISIQKKNSTSANAFEIIKLNINEMKCPYCRLKIDKILPYIPLYVDGDDGKNIIERINGINSPERYCMKHKDCSWVFKQGKDGGTKCLKNAYYRNNNNINNDDAYCDMHWKKIDIKHNEKIETINKDVIWTDQMTKYSKTKSIDELKNILRKEFYKVSGNKKELVIRIFEKNIIDIIN
jgi:hypothetical protein